MLTRFKSPLVYTGLALVLLGPLLARGYVLTLDMVFTPQWRLPATVSNDYPLQLLLYGLHVVLPADVIQKVVLLAIIILAGLGAHRLLQTLTIHRPMPTTAYYLAGLLYVCNPFTYERLMAGQYFVLWGMALLPWLLRALLLLLRDPRPGRLVTLLAWSLALGFVSLHSVAIALTAATAATAATAWQLWAQRASLKRLRRAGTMLAVAAVGWLAINSFWLVPTIIGSNQAGQQLASFGQADRQAFATSGETAIAQLGNVLRLQGFWPERYGLFVLPQDGLPGGLWWLVFGLLAALVLFGVRELWRVAGRSASLACLVTILVAAVLASGAGGDWLARYVPFFAGYREPHKFTMIIALGYALLAAAGLSVLVSWLERRKREVAVGLLIPIALALPLLWVPSMLWGARGQLRAADYPAGWYSVNQRLNQDTDDFLVLSLPWHMYLYADYAGRLIANPAAKFYDQPTIVSQDPELGGALGNSLSPQKSRLDALLATRPSNDQLFARRLADMDVKYVILAKDSDYQQYDYLYKQASLTVVYQDDDISLFLNGSYRP